MPFDFKAYDAKCNGLTPEELQREWEHYTRLISGASTSTAVSGLAVPLTMGISTIGVAMAAPAIHNARKKREIIQKHLQKHNATHHTRKRDVLGSMAVSGTIGLVTLGVGTMGADAVATAGAEHGISAVVENETAIKIVTHAALDGVGIGIEHAHTKNLKKKDALKAFKAAGVFEAVENAKAAEAGYSIQPYNPQNFAPGGSMAQVSSPPPYTPGLQRPPSYYAGPNHVYASDSKTPSMYMQNSYENQYVASANTGQYPAPQPYDPNQVQFQQASQTGGASSIMSVARSQFGESYATQGVNAQHIPQANYNNIHYTPAPTPAPSYPQTPVQQPQQMQTYQPQQQVDPYTGAQTQTSQELPPNPTPSSVGSVYEVKSMVESLPALESSFITAPMQRRPLSIIRKPVATPQREFQLSGNQSQSPPICEQPSQQDESHQAQPTNQVLESSQTPDSRPHIQLQDSLQQDPQLNQSPGGDSSVPQSTPAQTTEGPQYAPQLTKQSYPSPPIQGIPVDVSSFCGLDLSAPQPTNPHNSSFYYEESSIPPPVPVQQHSVQHIPEQPVQITPQETHRENPQPTQQQYPSYVEQQQTGYSTGGYGQQTPSSTSQAWRYSLPPSLAPSPLLTPSPQFTPVQSQPIPYFPPPPGQPEKTQPPATFARRPTRPFSYIQPRTQSQPYTPPEVQYPSVPIPAAYGSAALPTPQPSQASPPTQQFPYVPLHSKPQQEAPAVQYNTPGYSQTPLTPPYSPSQTIQQTGPSYFTAGAHPQYQNMYPAQYR